jgi:protein MAK16
MYNHIILANYTKALEIVSEQLEYFPKYLVHRNKQRLTKIHQMLIRMRKLKLKIRPKIVTTNTKVDRREIGNEKKALKAAQLDKAIENELLERLKQVSDGEIYNYPEKQYSRALSRAEKNFSKVEGQEEEDGEYEEGEEEDEEDEEDYNVEYVEDFEESDEDEIEELEADKLLELYEKMKETKNKRKQAKEAVSSSSKKRKGPRVEVEYEDEEEENPREMITSSQYNF